MEKLPTTQRQYNKLKKQLKAKGVQNVLENIVVVLLGLVAIAGGWLLMIMYI